MAKKHYRASKRQIELSEPKGILIPNSQKTKFITLSCIFVGLVFILGYLFGKKN